MGLGEPQTKADCLSEIENLTRTLEHWQNLLITANKNIARAKQGANKTFIETYRANAAQAKGEIAKTKARISALKTRMKTIK